MSVEGLPALQRRLHAIGDTQALLKTLVVSTIQEAQKNAAPHRRTGNLQRSIVPGPLLATSAVIEVKVPYAASMEYGAKPHIIRPKNARVLAWGGSRRLSGRLRSGSSATHFATIVHHPGNKPYPFLIPGAKTAIHKYGAANIIKKWNEAA
jgi:hypothetical protein